MRASSFPVSAGGVSDPARFIYACEDGKLRAWTPTVPRGWSTQSEVVVDEAADAAVFRGVAIDGARVFATDFHNARVDVYDAHWHRVKSAGAFVDNSIPAWYAPFGIQAIGWARLRHVCLPRAGERKRCPDRWLRRRVRSRRQARGTRRPRGVLNAPWGLAHAPRSFGRFGGDLLIGNFGDGRINAFKRTSSWLVPTTERSMTGTASRS